MILSVLVEKLKNAKWMIQQGAYNSLADSLNIKLADTTLKLSPVKAEFSVGDSSYDPSKGAAMGVIYVNGILVKGCGDDEAAELGLCDIDSITAALDEVATDPAIASVCLVFNSPGGETTGIEELARKIVSFPKPIYGWTETRAASAAYWLMSQCSYVGMTPSAEVGSVGVYITIEDYTEALKQAGIAKEAIYSGKYKLLGANFRSLTDEEKAILQADVTSQHEKFKQAILAKRQIEPSYFEGLTYEGKQALAANLVDVVVDDFRTYITNMTNTVTKINLPQSVEASNTPQAVAVPITAQASADQDKAAEVVPGVPEDNAEGHYDGDYAECPACKHTWKLDAKDVKQMAEAEPDKEPADQPAKAEDKPEDKQATAPTITKKAELPTMQEWQSMFGFTPAKESPLVAACREWLKK